MDLEDDYRYLADSLSDLSREIEKMEAEKEALVEQRACIKLEIERKAIERIVKDHAEVLSKRDELLEFLKKEKVELEKVRAEYDSFVDKRLNYEEAIQGLRDDEMELERRRAELERKRKKFIEWELEQEKILLKREKRIKKEVKKRKQNGVPASGTGNRKIEL